MKCLLVIAPRIISSVIVSESKRIVKTVYGKKINGVYYRVKSVNTQENSRRMFIEGNGEILEFTIKPHITLSQDIYVSEITLPLFITEIEKVLANQRSFTLSPLNIEDYGQKFTFYLEFRKNPQIVTIFKKLLAVSKDYISEERYNVYSQRSFVPHITILYDDIDPIKVNAAKGKLKRDLFDQPVKVSDVELWAFYPNHQNIIHKFPLSY